MFVKWNKKSKINGVTASEFLNSMPIFMQHETLYINQDDTGTVTEVQAKSVLADIHAVSPSLSDAEFIAEINRKRSE